MYRTVFPLIRLVPPETAHGLGLWALKKGLVPAMAGDDDPRLASQLWGRAFVNPIGLAAGFDKNAEALAGTLSLGFGFVEVGTLTPRPQTGNRRPRLFRLTADRAVINRLGFNNQGMQAAARQLAAFRESSAGSAMVGVNIGCNRETGDPLGDYRQTARVLGPFADYLVVNVSSPNTPGLRDLQQRPHLAALIEAVREGLHGAHANPPLLVKVAPDLDDAAIGDIAALAREANLGGLIISNTTISRPGHLTSRRRGEEGGLSGQPLFPLSTRVLGAFYRLLDGRMPLIGVGGVASGRQAYEKIRAGASLVQLYSGLVYEGPGLVNRIKRELAACLREDGHASLTAAIGAAHRL